MTRRHTWAQTLAELRGAQTSFTRAEIRTGRRIAVAELARRRNGLVRKARLAMAEAVRCVLVLRRDARERKRRAA